MRYFLFEDNRAVVESGQGQYEITRTPLWVITILTVLFALAAGQLARVYLHDLETKRVAQQGQPVEATLVGKHEVHRSVRAGGSKFFIEYRYTFNDSIHSAEARVRRAFYRAHKEKGEQLAAKVLPGEPAVARLNAEFGGMADRRLNDERRFPALVGFFILLFLGLFGGQRIKEWHILREGKPIDALVLGVALPNTGSYGIFIIDYLGEGEHEGEALGRLTTFCWGLERDTWPMEGQPIKLLWVSPKRCAML